MLGLTFLIKMFNYDYNFILFFYQFRNDFIFHILYTYSLTWQQTFNTYLFPTIFFDNVCRLIPFGNDKFILSIKTYRRDIEPPTLVHPLKWVIILTIIVKV